MIPNHYGYGVRNDEKPYAHKIPDGGNWRSLPEDEQKAFMKGSFYSGGGKTAYLRKMSWDEPALTVTASVIAKATCHLHPTESIERSEYMGDFNLTPQQPTNGMNVLELFCGGGLGAIGFKAAGYNIVKALDFDKNAVKAYRHNFGDYVEQADISAVDIDSLPDTDVIFGGPPCQDFSVAGKGAGADGERGKLVWRYLEIIERKQPKAFVFENVKGLITKRHRPTFDAFIEKFNEIGYEISWRVMSAWDYGVAQKRERVFIVGIRKDLGFTFEFPKPLEGDYQTRVLRDVIGDLPEPERQDCGKYWTPKSEYTYGQANRVQSLDKPSNTIPAHHNSGQPIHPTEAPRRFTVRECLRIQSAPDTYILPDDISLSAQYRIVGNGIASRVAWYIGCALADQLRFKSKA
ncbi:DNA cytosine methyltransferase [Bacillus amyloliquefaciens]|jgi:DNA (cytosine-5)-methyltransferase 1|nr:DNA cytosine methyltransferase [Bacillus amyloliquefaciens]MEC1838087.1 DNA cytosine methyltransferase [Bacillus amyloliquefaciens]MEC1846791.1 DNA cytosine methyltransferase [Bacillus amyloliquefaciens]MEC1930484.1 DNA cytosine methyltransferase [Bacillus amyloliquefaciens]MEC2021116.1 DNA cytosine methyltransferase [Bacillus amyloliquefaciens]MEC2050602.1 DNA cytosine methyltransferase [Bacillus amyloliquefaciens]